MDFVVIARIFTRPTFAIELNPEAFVFLEMKKINDNNLRTVSTKDKGFCARLGPRGKSRSLQRLLQSTKENSGSHAFFRDN